MDIQAYEDELEALEGHIKAIRNHLKREKASKVGEHARSMINRLLTVIEMAADGSVPVGGK